MIGRKGLDGRRGLDRRLNKSGVVVVVIVTTATTTIYMELKSQGPEKWGQEAQQKY